MSLVQAKLSICGMSCVNCQNRIERTLASLPGVQRISLSYQSGVCSITYDDERVSLRQIEEKIEDLGYQVLPQAEGTDMSRTVCFLAIIIALYILLQRLGILNLLIPSQLADSGMGYGMLFVVGLLTSVHCVAMCGGINLSQSLPQNKNAQKQKGSAFLPSIFYNLGRVISYTVIGSLLGLVGLVLGGGSGTGIPVLLQGVLKLIAGAVMIAMGINMLGIFPWLRRLNLKIQNFLVKGPVRKMLGSRRPLVVGLLNGLMPCGPLQSMQILALASGNPLTGAFSMLLFSLGTIPLMLGLGTLVSVLGKRFAHAVMNVGAVLVAVLGLSMLSQGGALSGMLLPDRLLFLVIGLAVVGIAASVPMTRKAYRIACVALSVTVMAAAGMVWQLYDGDDPAPEGSTVRIVDGVQEITGTAAFFPIQVDGTDMAVFAIRASDGTVRTAFNTCQSCFLSGRGYYLQDGDDLVCQNCGFHFTPDQVEIQSGGCNPWPIFADYRLLPKIPSKSPMSS